MGMRMFKQDDGKYGLFSTFDDRICAIDCDEEEMIQLWRERAANRAEQEMRDWIAETKGERPRHSNPMTLKQALKEHKFVKKPLIDDPFYADEVAWDKELREKNKP